MSEREKGERGELGREREREREGGGGEGRGDMDIDLQQFRQFIQ